VLQASPDGARLYGISNVIRLYDTRSLVPPEVDELLESLGSRFQSDSDMREFLQKDRNIEPRLREMALRVAESRMEESRASKEFTQKIIRLLTDATGSTPEAARPGR
jgi:hypothetical protein